MAGRFKQALAIFGQVCELPEHERTAFLDAHCPDATLRAEVESLLRHDVKQDPFLDATSPAREMDALAAVSMEPGATAGTPGRIGRYEVIRKIGQGGMGVIYEAVQESPRRRVALKVIQSGPESRAMLRRFQREVQVLGQLQHPGIAAIHEAGLADGPHGRQPFFAMELVDGQPLDQHIQRQRLTIDARLELLARVADAVQHAHQKGVIHRDLKPANILVTPQRTVTGGSEDSASTLLVDEIGVPKVLDFGIARITDADLHGATLQTEVGQLIGTLAYMSPEQVLGDSTQLDTRCDVYALGVMLYEMLAGRRPFDFSGCSLPEAARMIREDAPLQLGRINPSLRGDIETIVARAMEKNCERRYASAAELAADLRRHLANEPIEARPATALYVLSRFARRNRALVTMLAGTFAMLVVALFALAYGLLQAEEKRLAAQASNERLRAVVGYQADMLEGIDVEEMGRGIVDDLRAEAVRLTEENRAGAPQLQAFESLLARMNPATIAARSLNRSILARAVDTLDVQFADQPEVQTDLRHGVVGVLHHIGLPGESLQQARLTLAKRIETHGADDAGTLAIQHDMLDLLLEVGSFDEAIKVGEQVLADRRRTLGARHIETLRTQWKLGEVLTTASAPERAQKELRDAVDALHATVGPAHPETMRAEKGLADHYANQRQLDLARALYERVLLQQETALGPDNDETMATVLSLATLHFLQRQQTEALPLLQRYADSATRTLGNDHPSTLRARSQLAETLVVVGKLAEAEPILRDTLERQRRVMGSDHPSSVSTLRAAVRLALRRRAWDDAETYALEAHAVAERSVGPDHVRTISAVSDLYSVALKRQDYERAIEYSAAALAGFRRVVGPEHRRTATSAQAYAKALLANGDAQNAVEVLLPLVSQCRTQFPNESVRPGTLGTAVNALVAAGRAADAVPLAKELIAWLHERSVAGSSMARAYLWLGRAEYAMDDLVAARASLETARQGLNKDTWDESACALLQHALAARAGDHTRIDAARLSLSLVEERIATVSAEIRNPLRAELRAVVSELEDRFPAP